jgi:crotonobetainyl-CoA:carnitine CoA-transferase CaiB-like acyl-CoA transferase
MNNGPLEGLHVVEAGTFFSAPFAAMMLCDLGARVTKVEPPGKGDPFRSFSKPAQGVSAMFINVNRGKKSVVLDLKEAEGRRALVELVRDADVFIHNWRPGIAETLGVGDSVLSVANPRLIRVAISGYGPRGPLATRPAFDTLIQAQSGLAVFEAVDGKPRLSRTAIADKVTSMTAVQSVLAAVIARTKTGEGQLLELGMLDALAYFSYPDLFQHRTFVDDEGPDGHDDDSASLVVATANGHVVVQPITGTQLKRCCLACERPDWITQLKQCQPTKIRTELRNRLAEVLVRNTTEYWVSRFNDYDIPVAAVLNLSDHLCDAQVEYNQLYDIDEEPIGRVRRVRYPARFSGTPTNPQVGIPSLGTGLPNDGLGE